jgi:chromosome segregation ATPase
MVESREMGPVQATITLNGVAQSLDHVFGSGARAILRWPGAGSCEGDSAPMALEVSFSISSVAEEASKRAAGEISVVQQLEQLKIERAELQARVATLSEELQHSQEALTVSETGRLAAESKAAELSSSVSELMTKVAGLEEAANASEAMRVALAEQQGENERLTSEKANLQEELRDVRDDHEALTKRFALAQELKAKEEVKAYHAENAKASLEGQLDVQRRELEAKIDVVQQEKLALDGEVSKLRPEVEGLSSEKQKLEQQAKQLQDQRDAEASKVQTMQAETDALSSRVQGLEAEKSALTGKVDEYEKQKKKKKFF